MKEAFEYINGQLSILLEAKLEDFVERYFKHHSNNQIDNINLVVQMKPNFAREAIAAAHPHATNHDESLFLTTHLLNGNYDHTDKQGDVNELGKLVKWWRKAKDKKLIPTEASLSGMSPDNLAELLPKIEGLGAPYIQPGMTRRAIRILKPFKLGEVEHPKKGKLSVYHFNTSNIDTDKPVTDQPFAGIHNAFKSLCTGEHYGVCIMSPQMFMEYTKKEHGLFTFMDENGKMAFMHGSGDHRTEKSPGGRIVNPVNSPLPEEEQDILKKQVSQFIPQEKKLKYKSDMGVIEPEEAKTEILTKYEKHLDAGTPAHILKDLPHHYLPHIPEEIMPGIYEHLRYIHSQLGPNQNNQKALEPFGIMDRTPQAEPLKNYVFDRIVEDPNFKNDEVSKLMFSHMTNFNKEQIDKIISGSSLFQKNKLIGEYYSRHKIDDEQYEKLLNGDAKIKHNLLLSDHTNGSRFIKLIDGDIKINGKNADDDDLFKAIRSRGFRINRSSLAYESEKNDKERKPSGGFEPGHLYFHDDYDKWQPNEDIPGYVKNIHGKDIYGQQYEEYKKENEENKKILDTLLEKKPDFLHRALQLDVKNYDPETSWVPPTFSRTALHYILDSVSKADTPHKQKMFETIFQHPTLEPGSFIKYGLKSEDPTIRNIALSSPGLKNAHPQIIDEIMDVNKNSSMDNLQKQNIMQTGLVSVDSLLQHINHPDKNLRSSAMQALIKKTGNLNLKYAKLDSGDTPLGNTIRRLHHNREIDSIDRLLDVTSNASSLSETLFETLRQNNPTKQYSAGHANFIHDNRSVMPQYDNLALIPHEASKNRDTDNHYHVIVHPDTVIEKAKNLASSKQRVSRNEFIGYLRDHRDLYDRFFENHPDKEYAMKMSPIIKQISEVGAYENDHSDLQKILNLPSVESPKDEDLTLDKGSEAWYNTSYPYSSMREEFNNRRILLSTLTQTINKRIRKI